MTIIRSATELLIIGYLAFLAVYDIRHKRVTDRSLILFLPIILLKCTLTVICGSLTDLIPMLVGAAAGFGILLIAAMLTNGGIGGGDIKLAGVLGLATEVSGMCVMLTVASIAAVLYGAIYNKLKKTAIRIPFVPFMAVGYVITLII